MPKLTSPVLKQRIEAIREATRASVDALAEQWRTEVLIPFCSKHKLIV